MDPNARNRVVRTMIQVGIPAVLAALASATTAVGEIAEWWAPLALAVLTTVTSALHQQFRPAGTPESAE
jgi:hypothetical protein